MLVRLPRLEATDQDLMDSTVLHWVLRIQELEVRSSETSVASCRVVQATLGNAVQGIIHNRNAELHDHHLQLDQVEQELQDTLKQQVCYTR